jgi:hypothetical protein
LYWKEQVTQNEKLKLEDIPPNQKLCILQNMDTDIAALANVNQLSDHMVTHGDLPLVHI